MPTNLHSQLSLWGLFFSGILVGGAARLTCLRWWQVPEDDPTLATSLAPTLHAGDWVILWRLTPPGFGDLVLCPDPGSPVRSWWGASPVRAATSSASTKTASLKVNNSRAISERSCKRSRFEVSHPRTGTPVELRCDVETLGGVHHQRGLKPAGGLRPMPREASPCPPVNSISSATTASIRSTRASTARSPRRAVRRPSIFRLVSRLGFGDTESRLSFIQ